MVVNINYKPSTYPTYVFNFITKHRNKGKLMNYTSFSEHVNAGGFIQKTAPKTIVILSKQANQLVEFISLIPYTYVW